MEFEEQIVGMLMKNNSPIPIPKSKIILMIEDEISTNQVLKENGSKSAICAYTIKTNELYFKCFTCSSQINHCFCEKCYFNGDHQGHVVIYFNKAGGGVCDCGDQSLALPIFCKQHPNETKESTQEIQEINNKFDAEFVKSLQTQFNVEFFQYFSQLEVCYDAEMKANQSLITSENSVSISIQKKANQNKIQEINRRINNFITDLVEVLTNQFELTFLISMFFIKPNDTHITRHDCTNYEKYSFSSAMSTHVCTCSLLENVIRHIRFYDRETQYTIEILLNRFFVNPQFQFQLVGDYCQGFQAMFENYSDDSKIRGISYQFGGEIFLQKILTDETFLNACRYYILDGADQMFADNQKHQEAAKTLIFPFNIIHFVTTHDVAPKIWLEDPDSFERAMHIFQGVCYANSQIIGNEEHAKYKITYIAIYEMLLLEILTGIFNKVTNVEEKVKLLKIAGKTIFKFTSFQVQQEQKERKIMQEREMLKEKEKELNQKIKDLHNLTKSLEKQIGVTSSSITPAIEQSANIAAEVNSDNELDEIDDLNSRYSGMGYHKIVKKDKQQKIQYELPIFNSSFRMIQTLFTFALSVTKDLKSALALFYEISGVNEETLAEVMLEGVHYISRSIACAFHELLFNIDIYTRTGQFLIIAEIYINPDRNLFSKDLGFIQIAAMILSKKHSNRFQEELEHGVAEYFFKNPLLSSVSTQTEICLFDTAKLVQFNHIQLVVNTLISMYDFSLINSTGQGSYLDSIDWITGITSTLVIHAFHLRSNLQFSNLKGYVQSLGGNKQLRIEKAVSLVTNSKDKNLVAKDNFKFLHEPFYFLINSNIFTEFNSILSNYQQKPDDFDPLIGNYLEMEQTLFSPYGQEKNPYLQQICEGLVISGSLFTFLIKELKQANNDQQSLSLILKLIYTLLKRNENIGGFPHDSEYLTEIIEILNNEKIYITEDFSVTTKKVLQTAQFHLDTLNLQDNQPLEETQGEQEKEDLMSFTLQMKKKQSMEARNQVLSSFKENQEKFSIQFTDALNEASNNLNQNNRETDTCCMVCQKSYTQQEMLYLPVALTRDNLHKYYEWKKPFNFYQELFQTTEELDILGENSFQYVITSCQHFCHKVCLTQIAMKEKVNGKIISEDQTIQQLEQFCPTCKLHSNVLFPLLELFIDQKKEDILTLTQSYLESKQPLEIQTIDQILQKLVQSAADGEFSKQGQIYFNLKEDTIMSSAEQFTTTFQILDCALDEIPQSYKTKRLFNDEKQQFLGGTDFYSDYLCKLKESIVGLLQNSFVQGLDSYIEKTLIIARTTVLNFNILLFQLQPVERAVYFTQQSLPILTLSVQYLHDFPSLCSHFIQNNQYSFDSFWNNFAVEVLCCDLSQSEKLELLSNFAYSLRNKLFALFSLARTISFFSGSNDAKENLEKLEKETKANLNSQTFRDDIVCYLLPYLKLFAATLSTFFYVKDTVPLTQTNDLLEEEELQVYTDVFGGHIFNFETSFQTNQSQIEKSVTQLVSLYQTHQQIRIELFYQKNPCLKFSLKEFGKSFQEVHEDYFFNKCSLCQSYPHQSGSDLCICMICGDLICSLSCVEQSKNDWSNFNLGNLNEHSMNYHQGKTCYLMITENVILIMDSPQSFFHTYAFYDDIGQVYRYNMADIPTEKWIKSKFDQVKLTQIQNLIFQRRITHSVRNGFGNFQDILGKQF